MRIVHVLTRLLRGGSEENTVETCRWQAAAGHDVTLIHGGDAHPWWRDRMPGVAVLSLREMGHPVRFAADLAALRRLEAIYRDLRPEVIHTHQSKAGVLGRLAASAAPDARVVHGIHIVPFENAGALTRRAYLAAERLAARRTDLFLAVSAAAGAAYVAAGLARPDQVAVVRSGMDLARFRGAAPPADWRPLLRLTADAPKPPVALMLAAFEPRKRHIPFLRALRLVAPPELRLILAGSGPEASVRAEVARLGLSETVVFAGHRSDPEALLALADLTVLTSSREGLPRVAVQSVAAGCPMISTALPGLGELIEDGVNGVVTHPGRLEETAAAVLALLCNPLARARIAAGARTTDLSPWAIGALGPQTTALYRPTARHRAAA